MSSDKSGPLNFNWIPHFETPWNCRGLGLQGQQLRVVTVQLSGDQLPKETPVRVAHAEHVQEPAAVFISYVLPAM